MEELKDQIDEIDEQLQGRKNMELEQVKRKIEGEAKLTLTMDEARGTSFEKDMETLKSMSPFPSSSLSSLTLTDTLDVVELVQERRLRTDAKRTCNRLEVEQDASTSSLTLRSSLARPRRPWRPPRKQLAEGISQESMKSPPPLHPLYLLIHLLQIYIYILIVYFIFNNIEPFANSWRPNGKTLAPKWMLFANKLEELRGPIGIHCHLFPSSLSPLYLP